MRSIYDTDFVAPDRDTKLPRFAGKVVRYQQKTVDLAMMFVHQPGTAIDGGANIGMLANSMADYPELIRILAFEPAADAYECLRRNVRSSKICCVRAALGEAAGLIGIDSPETSVDSTLGQVIPGGTDVPVIRIDDLRLSDVRLIKLDVQGYELQVLKGAEETLKRCRPVCIVEVESGKKLPRNFGDTREAIRYLVSLGAVELWRERHDIIMGWEVPTKLKIKKLAALAREKAAEYAAGDPFPHICLKNALPAEWLGAVVKEINSTDFDNPEIWVDFNKTTSIKKACRRLDLVGPHAESLFAALQTQEFVSEVMVPLTGIEELVPDPNSLTKGKKGFEGGGLSLIPTGGFLGVHADFNLHRGLNKYRRVNLLLYLNHDWKLEYGGSLQLWDESRTRMAQNYVPEFNHCVIFNTDDFSYHGHPDPISHPTGRPRIAISVYYYADEPPTRSSPEFHSTKYVSTDSSAGGTGRAS